ncbi:HAMP domain-containing protein [Calothrix sp. FACHB-1219]|uniref:adenylate/guanylate cyclase domain-containing protein n=1 Tax=unclassified Calothrix TaxID=2619626 RepID=UPI001683D136|nr:MULTISPECIES: adenylate/guanylate cyclase domain-containing protein [unclassified Calothrix]MBD2206749.1 HAMP domain-containing protein [Calothrix sp. FACHB-168]MBD2218567.1 HAMP domain-containing protein [Calothrix sp. FACHB-1219]
MRHRASSYEVMYKQMPLRVIFVFSTLLQVITAVGLTGYFSFLNGQKAVNEVATQLRDEVTARVKDQLLVYIETPHLINRLNANAIELGQLDIQNTQYKQKYFWQQIRTFSVITYNFYGDAAGEYLGARRLANGELQVMQRDRTTGHNQYFATNNQGDRTKLIQSLPNFDARQRPWYQEAVAAGKPTWSKIYSDFSTGGLAITAAQPVYDKQGKLKGVLGSEFIFYEVNRFLQSLKIGKSGQTFIMERSGLLVATSTPDASNRQSKNPPTQRIKASESQNYLIQQSAKHLEQKFGDFAQIHNSQLLDFEIQGERQFLQVTPLKDSRGLDCLIAVVIPEADFMARIQENTRLTVMLCLLSLIIATVLGLQTSLWIVKPIQRLNHAARDLADGNWEQKLVIEGSYEIGELAESFTSMAQQLKELFATLEQKVRDRTQALAKTNQELKNRNALIRQIFGRYLSDEIVSNLLETPQGLELGGTRKKITILISDLRGFTATAERLSPEEVIKILNFYLEYMADVITHYEGTIDEFMGDGILTLFGAPTMRENDTKRAIACAIAMQQAMIPVNQQMQLWGFPPLEMGIGIHTGEVVVGNIGSVKRTKYGVVGNHINLAYRIEACSVGGQIIISEDVLEEVRDIVKVDGKQQVQMKGVKDPINLYEISGIAGEHNLYLTKSTEEFHELPEPILLQYVTLESKHVGDRLYAGEIIQLSHREALIKYNSDGGELPPPLTNLKLILLNKDVSPGVGEDFYAKVLEKPAPENSFYIHFTSLPPSVRAMLDRFYDVPCLDG